MRIALGADHAGFTLKDAVAKHLAEGGHEVIDYGTDSTEPVDYPPFCAAAARAVVAGHADVAIGGRILAVTFACAIVDVFLATPFEGGRHARRLGLIADIEREECASE